MKYFIYSSLAFLMLTASLGAYGQATEKPASEMEIKVYGKPYDVPEIRVFLTDEGTGGPYADRSVVIRYYWKWDVIKSSPETERMSNILHIDVPGRTDPAGLAIVPGGLIVPYRAPSPAGSELSEPRFYSVGIIAKDEKHHSGLAIYDATTELHDGRGEVRRTVMLYPRPR
jgi:hypothetical protein